MTIIGFPYDNQMNTLAFDVHGYCDSWALSQLVSACGEQNRMPTFKEFRSLPNCLSVSLVDKNGRVTWRMDKYGEQSIAQCLDCHYYHGKDRLICALHPSGVDGDCADFRGA